MKVSVFIDRTTISTEFTPNCIYRLSGYRTPLKPQSSYALDFNRSLYLVGGRNSIIEFCRNNPFRLTAGQGAKFAMRMVRGVPGLSEAERKKLGVEKEPFISNAIGIFKKKTLTIVQLLAANAVSANELAMPKPSSTCLPELIALHDSTMLTAIMATMSDDAKGVEKAFGGRTAHNRKLL